jgi:peptidoglycan/LPS O-acetylase OafA/YrhL
MNSSLAEISAVSSTASIAPDNRRLHWVESLRGVAVSAVFVHHLMAHKQTASPQYLDLGIFGVIAFFCISGYVIPYSAFRAKQNPAYRFLITRLFRLYPAYWLSLIFGAAVLGAGAVQFIVNLSMLQRFFGVSDVVGAYWTLQVEILFYVIIGGLLFVKKVHLKHLYPGLSLMFGVIALLLACVRFYIGKKAPITPPIGLAVMFAATTYYLHVSFAFLSKAKMIIFASLLTLLLSATFILGYSQDWGYQETPHRFFAMFPLAVALFLLFSKLGLDHALLRFMGKVSYPVYLVHVPMIALLFPLFHNIALRYIVTIMLTLLASLLIHNFIEKPGIELGRRFLKA